MYRISKWLLVLGSVCIGHAQPSFPLYLDSGGGGFVDQLSETWIADSYFSGGSTDSCDCVIYGAGYQRAVYATRRYGSSFSYSFTGIPAGTYNIVFKFAEWQVQSVGARVFNVTANGVPILNNYDIYALAGFENARDEIATAIPVPLGILTISFTQNGGSYPAQINGMVITRNSSPPTTLITACQEITTPGNYALAANLTVTSDPCLNVHDTGSNTTTAINCLNYTITNNTGSGYAVMANNVPNFGLSNCSFVNSTNLDTVWSSGSPYTTFENLTLVNGNIDVFAGSDYSSVLNNSLTKGTINVYGGPQNVTVANNTVNLNFLGAAHPTGILIADANGANVTSNTVHGDAASQCSTANGSCTDDGITVESSSGEVISAVNVIGNTITDVYDCGIEFLGIAANVAINNNTITRSGYSGIGGWWGFSMRRGAFVDNHVDTSPGLFIFSYFAGDGYSQASSIDFYDVLLANNTLSNPVSISGVNNFFDFSAYATSTQNVYGNILMNNDFGGSVAGKIGFSVPSGYIDGGNNFCTSASPSYPSSGFPIQCQTPASCSTSLSGAFRGCYYSNPTLSGSASIVRMDLYPLSFNWGGGSPACSSNLPSLGSACPQEISATWNGSFPFGAGTYTFTANINGAVVISIDGSIVFNRSSTIDTMFAFSHTFPAAGTHEISVTYEGGNGAGLGGAVGLSWAQQ